MGSVRGRRALAAIAITILAAAMVSAQQSTVEEGKRKTKFRVNPQYSDLARRMNLAGKVRLEIVIAPDGHVKSWRAVGGHPLLVQSCVEVIKDWKYEPAPEESSQIIEFEFRP